jgi:molybdate transport system substrate-binding protein
MAGIASAPALLGALLLPGALLLSACGGEAGSGGPPHGEGPSSEGGGALLILAASDLVAALPEIARLFEVQTGTRAEFVLGSSGNLAAQIEHGAPADLYLSANRHFVDRLEDRGHLVPGARRDYAVGRLALVSAPGRPLPDDLAELAHPGYQVIALANPEHAPYGMAAREALESAGLWNELRPRLVYAENIAQATQFIRTGNADAGIVALGVILGDRDWPHRLVEAHRHGPLLQAAAVVRGSRREAAARAFLEFLVGPEGQAVLARYGFEPPSGSSKEAPDR